MSELASSILVSVVTAILGWLGKGAWANRRRLMLCGLTRINPDEMVRISAAYLFRIRIGGKFLLIRGNRIRDQYQPVGGVFQYFAGAEPGFREMGCNPDDRMKNSSSNPRDLRVILPRKNVLKFLDWFDSRKDREITTLREFYEELVKPKFLPESCALNFNPQFVRQCDRQLKYSEHLGINEILVHEVYEIVLNEKDQESISSFINDHTAGDLLLVDEQEIRRRSVEVNGQFFNIAPTAGSIL